MSWLVRLYPKRWRERYGAELSALMEDAGGGWRWDVVAEALRMHFTHWSVARLIVAGGLLGAVIGGIWTLALPARYASEVVMRSTDGPDSVALVFQQSMSRQKLSAVIRKYNLYSYETAHMPMEEVIEKMRRDIRIGNWNEGTNLVSVRYANGDGKTAQAVANELAQESQTERFRIIRPPSEATRAEGPARLLIVGIGLALGLAAGAMFGVVTRRPVRNVLWMAGCGAAGCVAALCIAAAIPNRYVSTAVVRIAQADLGLVREAAGARENLQVSEVGRNADTLWLSVSYASRDRREAQRVVTEVTSAMVKRAGRPSIIDPASLPFSPVYPNRLTITWLGLVFGLCLGLWKAGRNGAAREEGAVG